MAALGGSVTYTIGVDVGGTKVAAGVVDERGRVVARDLRSTPSRSVQLTAQAIADAVAALRREYDVDAVGIGAAGWVSADRSTVLFAPNLAWRDEPLRDAVAARIGLPVVVENDANAMAWAEHRFGAGRGEPDLVAITLGTGIGGAIVIGGEVHRGRWGVAGEFGHARVAPDGRPCGCGNRGCWEQYASGTALAREARDLAAAAPARAARLIELAGGQATGIAGPEVTVAAQEGDPAALECFAIVGRWLGQGLADLAATLDPGCFVVGGGLADAGDLLLGPARTAYAEALSGRGFRPLADVRRAALGNQAGLIGAADLARRDGR